MASPKQGGTHLDQLTAHQSTLLPKLPVASTMLFRQCFFDMVAGLDRASEVCGSRKMRLVGDFAWLGSVLLVGLTLLIR